VPGTRIREIAARTKEYRHREYGVVDYRQCVRVTAFFTCWDPDWAVPGDGARDRHRCQRYGCPFSHQLSRLLLLKCAILSKGNPSWNPSALAVPLLGVYRVFCPCISVILYTYLIYFNAGQCDQDNGRRLSCDMNITRKVEKKNLHSDSRGGAWQPLWRRVALFMSFRGHHRRH
jgi:hypothetical protein